MTKPFLSIAGVSSDKLGILPPGKIYLFIKEFVAAGGFQPDRSFVDHVDTLSGTIKPTGYRNFGVLFIVPDRITFGVGKSQGDFRHAHRLLVGTSVKDNIFH